jgi:hypothetical protein
MIERAKGETIMLAKIGLFELVTAALVMAVVLVWAAILSG